ncbi:MAG: hypothetical protein IPM26_07075 [Saprospiraceae bacterium]|nr:hypothetical protein [Saprospiraceae bacterium]
MKAYLYLLFIPMFFAGCKKDNPGELILRFRLKYGNQDLKMFENYKYPMTNENINFSRIAFYISDIGISKNIETSKLVDIDYIDFTIDHTAPNGKGYYEYKIRKVDPGKYDKVNFGIGVPADMNAKEPKDFPASNVLSTPADYWTAWKSYIFMRNEGRIDLDGDGSTESPFALHLGGNEAYIPVEIRRTFSIAENQSTILDIQIDMQKLFNGKSLYNIREARQLHSLSQMPFIMQLVENMKTGIN